MRRLRQQSAMEYLTTYGWAILIIAVVLVAMFQLGVFGGSNTKPYTTAGACQVLRTVQGVNLEGLCNNVPPQFVAQMNGASSFIKMTNVPALDSVNAITVAAWIKITGSGQETVVSLDGETGGVQTFVYAGGNFAIWNSGGTLLTTKPVNDNNWHFVVGTWQPGVGRIAYVDGVQVGSGAVASITAATHDNQIGTQCGAANSVNCNAFLNGQIANVQVYNTSLSQSEVQALYLKGIGGAPVDPTHLVGWWPLNGNAQDYSGLGYGGTPAGVSYNSTWALSYTPP